MRVMVTGGAGYIGSVVARQLLSAGHEVTVLDDLSTGHADAVPARATFVERDVADIGQVFAGSTFDAVMHFAAKSLVGESVQNPAKYWHGNTVGTLALLDAMLAHGVPHLVFSSTCATYGQPPSLPITEQTPTAPTSPYGASKLAIDLAITDYAGASQLSAVSLRYFNVAGAHDGAGERHTTETHLIPNALLAARDGRAMTLFGTDYDTPDGTCVRDYIHVADLGEAHLLALDLVRPGQHTILNLGSGNGYSNREVIDTVRAVTGHDVPVVESGRRPGDPAKLIASNEAVRTALGWAPTRDLTTMVGDAWAFEQDRARPA